MLAVSYEKPKVTVDMVSSMTQLVKERVLVQRNGLQLQIRSFLPPSGFVPPQWLNTLAHACDVLPSEDQ